MIGALEASYYILGHLTTFFLKSQFTVHEKLISDVKKNIGAV